jgi:PEP-CTERM motif
MIRGLVICAVALMASVSQAATVKFSGTYSVVVGTNNLNIAGKAFLATVETDNAANILSGQLWLNPASVAATEVFTLNGGTIALGGGNTTFSGINVSGATGTGVVQFQIASQAAGFSQADLFTLTGISGSSVLSSAGNVYSATITAVPEPSSMLALAGLVVGCATVSYRRRLRKTAA